MFRNSALWTRLSAFASRYSIFIVLAGLFLLSFMLNPRFLSPLNITNVLTQNAVVVIIAFGATKLIISGMIDLSVGAVVAFSGIFAIWVFRATENLALAFAAGVALAVAFNAASGYLVAYQKTPPFIATLAMMVIARGGVLLFTGGRDITGIGRFVVFGQGRIGFVPIPVVFMFAALIIAWYILNHTGFGRSLYAIGGNQEAANAAGIDVRRTRFMCYIVNGCFVGVAGIIFMSRINAGIPGAAIGMEMDVLTAAIIGGTSFSGGVGTAGGTIAGAFIVGIVNNIMVLEGINPHIQQITRGAIIVLAVILDIRTKNRRVAVTKKLA